MIRSRKKLYAKAHFLLIMMFRKATRRISLPTLQRGEQRDEMDTSIPGLLAALV